MKGPIPSRAGSTVARGLRNAALLAAGLSLTAVLPASLSAQNMPAGGRGPIQVLLVTKGHGYDRAPFFAMFDALGETITWTHVEHPAAQVFWDPRLAEPYDVFVYYDMAGRAQRLPNQGPYVNYQGGTPGENPVDIIPSPQVQAAFASLLRQGKGMVFFHHSLASWVHTWPEYVEVMGGACDWGRTINIRGMEHPRSGYHQDTEQTITVVARDHPITRGLGESFQLTDESYSCPMFEDSVTPLLRTSWRPPDQEFHTRHLNPNYTFSNLFAWAKSAENSPIVYIQGGHDRQAWENENFRQLMRNAIEWAASDEAHAWARANPSRIF
jgi:uncharacterized protein